jgi:FtsP/CotA-like multicopper oxidase with cupredoxin domain
MGAAMALRVDTRGALAYSSSTPGFKVPLRIPPVARPVRRADGRDYYEMVQRRARVEILPGTRTPIWGFDGGFPGPTIKARRGRPVVIRRINRLDVPVTTHLHGGKVPSGSDGNPGNPTRPGRHYDYLYPNDQDGATLWYHDHTHHHTTRNNHMGLSGLYIVRDEDEDDLNLPKGRYDIPLMLQDRSFKRDGSFRFHNHRDDELGNVYLVNGRPTPFFRVANRKYRFRIVNASASRGYDLALDSGAPLVQIATDQGLLGAPMPVANIPLWPAERAEVVIDFSRYPVGTKIVLLDRNGDGPGGGRPIMRFNVAREEPDNSSLPAVLRPVPRLLPGTIEREFALSQDPDTGLWVINGKPFDPNRVDIEPRLGDTEVWTFRNQTSVTHPMHVHLVRFQVLQRSNLASDASDLGWKDTVRVDPSATVRVVMKFEGFAGRYMYHCHNLAHEDHSMMGQMRVVK